MAKNIGYCDNCDKLASGHVSMSNCGEGFFCYRCRGDIADPYGEFADHIRLVKLAFMMDWRRKNNLKFVDIFD